MMHYKIIVLTRCQGGSGGSCGHQILEPGVLLHGLQGLPGLSMLAADFQVSGQAAGQCSDIGKAM